MISERPACAIFKTLGPGLAYVMEQGRPPQPHVIRLGGDAIKDLHSVVKYVLMREASPLFNALEGGELREYILQKAHLVEQFPRE